jgi:hypothetical protein
MAGIRPLVKPDRICRRDVEIADRQGFRRFTPPSPTARQVETARTLQSFSLRLRANDLTIRLGRGSVMVEAAKRRKGHLFVDTGDCRVAVTGTLFGVSAGVKGSRVSVVQGEVHVAQDSQEQDSARAATRP